MEINFITYKKKRHKYIQSNKSKSIIEGNVYYIFCLTCVTYRKKAIIVDLSTRIKSAVDFPEEDIVSVENFGSLRILSRTSLISDIDGAIS